MDKDPVLSLRAPTGGPQMQLHSKMVCSKYLFLVIVIILIIVITKCVK